MRLLCITDLHGRLAMLTRILAAVGSADAILFGGDITDFGSPVDVDKIIGLAQQSQTPVFAVAGNCDSAEIDRRLVELGVSLSGRGAVLAKVGFHGVSGRPPWKKGMYHFTEEQLAALLQAGYETVRDRRRVILAHVPPHATRLDRTIFGCRAGSTALKTFIEHTQPALVVCGHIHEGRGIDHLGSTTVVNCGQAARGEYAVAEIDDGEDDLAVELHTVAKL